MASRAINGFRNNRGILIVAKYSRGYATPSPDSPRRYLLDQIQELRNRHPERILIYQRLWHVSVGVVDRDNRPNTRLCASGYASKLIVFATGSLEPAMT